MSVFHQIKYMFAVWIKNFDSFIPEWEFDYYAGERKDRPMPQGCDEYAVVTAYQALLMLSED